MRVAVYNRHWPTAGGGERYAGAFAQALAREHEVTLLSHGDVDWNMLDERLELDLRTLRRVPLGERTVAEASRDFDLLVNCSYMSSDVNGAAHGIYVVLFPTPFDHDLSWKKRLALRTLGRFAQGRAATIEFGFGFHQPEASRRHRYRWTAGDARALVGIADGTETTLTIAFGRRPDRAGPTDVEVEIDGRPAGRTRVTTRRPSTFKVPLVGRGADKPIEVALRSDVFVPKEILGSLDGRTLGVQVRGLQAGGRLAGVLQNAWPWLATPPPSLSFLDSYDLVVSISEYTADCVRRFWGSDSEVLYPPVKPVLPRAKEPLILSVGRFFDRASGHSKKQLELVKAFRRLVGRGVRGWELHLAGGCSPDHVPYLERVRAEARDLPVRIHANVPAERLRELYGRASVFWHAAGLGESPRRHPHRFEHFGITTVEAMSAGAVPVVVRGGGQPEIVADGTNGFLVSNVRELVSATERLIADGDLRARLGAAARCRALDFSDERFAERARALALAAPNEDQSSSDVSGRRSERIEIRNE